MPKKDKCVMFCTSSAYVMGVANVIIGIEKYSPNLIDNYLVFYNADDPIKDNDVSALEKISKGKVLFRHAMKNTVLSTFEIGRWSPLLLQKFHIFELLKEYRHAIYLEADMLVQGDISEAFSYGDLSFVPHPTKLIAGVRLGFHNRIIDFVNSKSIAPQAGVILVNDNLLTSKVDYTQELYEFARLYSGANIGMTIDELCIGLLAAKFKMQVTPLPEKYHFNYLAINQSLEDAVLIHTVGYDKFWNNRLCNIFYPEWNINNRLWEQCGGSGYSGNVKYLNVLGNFHWKSYAYLDKIIQEHTGVPEYRILLQDILDYAGNTDSWNNKVLTNNSDIICAYGLGEYFEDQFALWGFKAHFNVKYCCDRDEEYGKKVAKQYGLDFVSFSDLLNLNRTKQVVVILFLGNPYSIQKDFIAQGLQTVASVDCVHCMHSIMPNKKIWFSAQKNIIINVYDGLNDAESKMQFTNIMANHMAPHMAKQSYAELNNRSLGAYFKENFIHLGNEEVLCDCGAYVGDTIDYFLRFVTDFKFIYAYEIAADNFEILKTHMKEAGCYFDAIQENKYKLFHAGVWESSGEVSYGKENKAGCGSYTVLKKNNAVTSKAVTIDETVDMPITFIKMNIEGAEMNALRGAENTIRKYHPTLAINISHRLQDLWMIPAYLKQLVPSYKLYIRHVTSGLGGTILYAIFGTEEDGV